MPIEPAGIAVYVHLPWCVRKCPYCDFNSHPINGTLDEPGYTSALLTDLAGQLPAVASRRITSVFFGGGTPSLFGASTFAEVLRLLEKQLAPDAEITLEANPGTTEQRDLASYRQAGINRLSLGAQSFDPGQLKRLGRIHGPGEIEASLDRARQAGFDNINLDVMYGLPMQTPDGAAEDLRRAISLDPEHISWYQLTIEAKTAFAANPPLLPTSAMLEEMEVSGRKLLAAAGFQRYEVSAYARPGRRCAHNVNYWSFGDYLGIGAGAHGKMTLADEVVRTSKPRQPRLYLADPAALTTTAVLPHDLPGEFMLNALRLVDGVSRERFEALTGLPLESVAPSWRDRVAQGLLREDRLATTARGYPVLDSLVSDFL